MTKPEQSDLGKFLTAALKRRNLSQRAIAKKAQLSEGRLRQILSGYASVGGGQYAVVSAPPSTVARIAAALRVSPSELKKFDPEAAEELVQLTEPPPLTDSQVEQMMRMSLPGAELTDEELLDELERRLAERRKSLRSQVSEIPVRDEWEPQLRAADIDPDVPEG